MIDLGTVTALHKYNDWANGQLLRAAEKMSDEELDAPFDMGRGALRITLMHILAGEQVWLKRWQGRAETPWPDEQEKVSPTALASQFDMVYAERSAFLKSLKSGDLGRNVVYRDSKGSLFQASLGDMLIQGLFHSHHHRAQAVNMIRRVGGGLVELDYMMWLRQPA